jgi:hypothetical protein
MTQQTPGDAVGAASDTVVAAEPTIQDRFAAISGDEQEEKKPDEGEEAEAPQGAEADELTVEDVTEEGEAEAPEEGAEPPIAAPVSWTAEEKEEFGKLPPAVQKTIARRETERETFVQAKAQEAKQTRATVEREALTYVDQLQTTHAQQLQALLPQIPEKPSYQLQVDDPYLYADMMDAHERALAQYNFAQQQLQQIGAQQAQRSQQAATQKAAEMREALVQNFPEFLDPATGPKLQQELESIATDLGYRIAEADTSDILAMKKVATYKSKADKYDALMAQKMQRVREAKGAPRVSRPGAAQPKGAAESQRYQSDREAMRGGDKDATNRVFGRFLP